jgi:hypothetical protein
LAGDSDAKIRGVANLSGAQQQAKTKAPAHRRQHKKTHVQMMKLKKYFAAALLATAGLALVAPSAKAQNPNNNTGDLLLGFQNPGGTTGSDQTVLVSLGNVQTLYRDATGNSINIINISSLLTNTFGSNWWELTTLYVGALEAHNSGTPTATLLNGDPKSTIYVSSARTAVGTVGSASSPGYSGFGVTALQSVAGDMLAVAGNLEQGGSGAALAISTSASDFDNYNPVTLGIQGTAYDNIGGGTQYQFGAGIFGVFASVNAEAALDLYRLQAANNKTGQYGFGNPIGEGEYQGSLVIDQGGNVSFINAVPEPSSMALLGMGVLGLIARRRRS